MRIPWLPLVLSVLVALASAGAISTAASRPQAAFRRLDGTVLTKRQIDAEVERLRTRAKVPGLALALIAAGRSRPLRHLLTPGRDPPPARVAE